MFFVSIHRILKTSIISLWRNLWLSLAAILIMILTLFTISFFVTLLFVTSRTTTSLQSKVDISAFFNDTTSKDQIFAIENNLLSMPEVKSVDYVSKEDALGRWQERNKDNEKLRNLVSANFNPLPRSLEVKTDKPENLEKVYGYLSSADYQPLIKEISYQKNRDLINRLMKITTFIKIIGWVLSSVFILVSILIIYNTIRLTIYARHDEIEIMKLVGATDWYTEGPFFVEGLMYGLVASIISAVALYFGYTLSMPAVQNYLDISILNSGSLGLNFWFITFVQIVFGLVLGTLCSVLAVKKHLKK
ncbi:MAG: permease-like cell division protein FtsX [Patescibacteria group bacterium]